MLLPVFCLVGFGCFAQPHCNLDERLAEEFQDAVRFQVFDDFFDSYYELQYDSVRANIARIANPAQTVIRIPVVVHVIGSELALPSDLIGEVNQALTNANYCLRKTPNTIGDGEGVDVFFKFCLASEDPDGNPTSGVIVKDDVMGPFNVIDTTAAGSQRYEPSRILFANNWDPARYLNILVLDMADPLDLGQTFLPWTADWEEGLDGIILEYDSFMPSRYSLNSSPKEGKNLVHEFGHYMGLLHTFSRFGDELTWDSPSLGPACLDDECSWNGDRMCDTPPCCFRLSGVDAECPVDTRWTGCSGDMNTCSNDSPDLIDPITNYMHYNYENCMNEFTSDQGAFMLHICQSLRPYFLNTNNACGGVEPSCDDEILNNGEWGVDCGGPCPVCAGGAAPPCASSPQNTVPSGLGSLLDSNPVPHKLIYDCLKGNLDGSANRIMGMSISVGTDDLFYHGGNVHLVAGTTEHCVSIIQTPWTANLVLGSGIRVYPGGLRVIASEEDEIHMELKKFTGYGNVDDYDACPSNAPGWRLADPEAEEEYQNEQYGQFEFILGLSDIASFSVVPNPNSGTFTIDGTGIQQITIMDASGKLVRQMAGPFGTAVEVSSLGAGLYVVRVQMEDGSIETGRVVVAP